MSPLVSIIMPVCNVEKYLAACLESAIHQDLHNVEIICVNDGSKDSSLSILQEYAAKDDRVVIIDKQNAGYGAAMNDGLRIARGRYIGILESDDRVCKNSWKKLLDIAEKNDLDVIRGNYYNARRGKAAYFDLNHSLHRHAPAELAQPPLGTVITVREYPRVAWLNPAIWTGLYRRDFLLQNNIWFNETPGASYQDTSFAFKVWMAARRAMLVDVPVIYYTVDNESSSSNSKAKVFAVCDEMDECERYLDSIKADAFGYQLLAALRYKTYAWNELRVGNELKRSFHQRMWAEICRDYERGYCTLDLFTKGDLAIIEAHAEGRICVSVIVPILENDPAVSDFLEDIRSQTLDCIEVVCAVSERNANAAPLLEAHAREDSRIRVVETSAVLVGDVRNEGLKETVGEYVLCLDSSDRPAINLLESLYMTAKNTGAEIVFHGKRHRDRKPASVSAEQWRRELQSPQRRRPFSVADSSDDLYQVTTPEKRNKIYEREFVLRNDLRYQNLGDGCDLAFLIEAFASAAAIAGCRDHLVYLRKDEDDAVIECVRVESPSDFTDALRWGQSYLADACKWDTLKLSFSRLVTDVIKSHLTGAKHISRYLEAYDAAHQLLINIPRVSSLEVYEKACDFCLGEFVAQEADASQALYDLWGRDRSKARYALAKVARLNRSDVKLKGKIEKLKEEKRAKTPAPQKRSFTKRVYGKIRKSFKKAR